MVLWLAGRSASEIASELSTEDHTLTRSAVMGVIRRSGVYRPTPGPVERVPHVKADPSERVRRSKYA